MSQTPRERSYSDGLSHLFCSSGRLGGGTVGARGIGEQLRTQHENCCHCVFNFFLLDLQTDIQFVMSMLGRKNGNNERVV